MNRCSSPHSVSVSSLNGIVKFTLARPKSLNALTMEQVNLMEKQLRSIRDDPSHPAVVFIGAGDRAFCAGGDVLHIADPELAKTEWNRRWFSHEFLLNHLISQFKKPVVSIWRGIVMGGGVGLSIYGSHRIATETTLFAMPETSIGFFPDVGSSYFLSHTIAPSQFKGLGLFLGMTGHRLNGADVLKCGLATHYVPSSRLDEMMMELDRGGIDVIKRYSTDPTIASTLTPEFLKSASLYFGNIEEMKFVEFFEGLENGAKKGDEFAQSTLKTIRSKCPLTVRVWYESYKRGSRETLAQTLAREYNMCIQSTEIDAYNFREGVRAQLIEKNRGTPPKYKPARLEDVTDAMVSEIVGSKAGGDLLECIREDRLMYNY
jgi:enoyl-CoA hydratase/carnithine racemase